MQLQSVQVIVTAGPTVEPIDAVRRLTNHSTGRLGCRLADTLSRAGHKVTLLLSQSAQHKPRRKLAQITPFLTTQDLRLALRNLRHERKCTIFHAAAVSDYIISSIQSGSKSFTPNEGKISTQTGQLRIDLKPAPKIIRQLPRWFPAANIVGWKYEVDGTPGTAIQKARLQVKSNRTHASVVNGPAYGKGYALVTANTETHITGDIALFRKLARQL